MMEPHYVVVSHEYSPPPPHENAVHAPLLPTYTLYCTALYTVQTTGASSLLHYAEVINNNLFICMDSMLLVSDGNYFMDRQ